MNNILIELRGNKSRAEVAKDLGITTQGLGLIERGERTPRKELMIRFSEYYKKIKGAVDDISHKVDIKGKRTEEGKAVIEQRNKFSVHDEIEIMKPDGSNILAVVEGMWDEENNPVLSAPHPKQILKIQLSAVPDQYDLLRVKKAE